MDPARRLATYDDLLTLPEGARAEVLSGELVSLPAPLPQHAKISGAVRRFIGGPFDDDDGFGGPGGWWILQEVDVRFGAHDIVRPDITGWRRARLAEPWDVRPIDVCPDWICEVLSPSNRAHDRVTKHALYRAHGVPHYWVLDPEARVLEADVLRDAEWVVRGYDDTMTARVAPFEPIALDVGRLFPPPRSAAG